MDASGMAYSNPFGLFVVIYSTKFIEQIQRICLNHSVKHILNLIGSCSLMCNDKRV